MAVLRDVDLRRARLVPSSMFPSPGAVLEQEGLSIAQKSAILRRWEFDARRISGVADASGRGHRVLMLKQIRRALQKLGPAPAGKGQLTPDSESAPEALRPQAGDGPTDVPQAGARSEESGRR